MSEGQNELSDTEVKKILDEASKKKVKKSLNDVVDPTILEKIAENIRKKGKVWKKTKEVKDD